MAISATKEVFLISGVIMVVRVTWGAGPLFLGLNRVVS